MLAFLFGTFCALADPGAVAAWARRQPAPEEPAWPATGYRFAGRAFAELAERAAERPGVVTVEELGRSGYGAPIFAFHVERPGASIEREVLVFAGIHAMEWISTEVAVELLIELIAHPPPDARVTVVPLLNPDGRIRVERDLQLGHTENYRRGNAANVDLNRDFAVHTEARAVWRHVIPGYYERSQTPLSQPETRALDALLDRRHYDRVASLHAFGGYLYYPWAGRFARPDSWAAHHALGREMERAQGPGAYRPRQLGRWGFFFRAQGAELDHIHAKTGALTYLVELTRSGVDPLRPRRSWKTPFVWYNPKNVARHRAKGVAAMRALIHTEP